LPDAALLTTQVHCNIHSCCCGNTLQDVACDVTKLLQRCGRLNDTSVPALLPQVRLIAAMLSPLLEAVASHPSLADPARAAAAALGATHYASMPGSTSASPIPGAGHSPRPSASSSSGAAAAAAGGGTASAAGGAQALKPLGPVAAAAAALLQLRLLEVFFFLPAAQLWSSCHEQLLQLCCRQLLGVGGSRVSPGEGNQEQHEACGHDHRTMFGVPAACTLYAL
jgi:hypothetical protein